MTNMLECTAGALSVEDGGVTVSQPHFAWVNFTLCQILILVSYAGYTKPYIHYVKQLVA